MMADAVAAPAGTTGTATRRLVLVLLAGGAVAVALGVYGEAHDPTHEQPYTFVFTGTIQFKVWFATAALALAVLQVLLGLRLYDKVKVPRRAPAWLGDAHRLVGTLAFACVRRAAVAGADSSSGRIHTHTVSPHRGRAYPWP